MDNRTKLWLLLSAGILTALLAVACGMQVGQLEPGYNLVLTVGSPQTARLVEVETYDVTRLNVLVTRPAPDGEGGEEPPLVDEFDWYPNDGLVRYVINLGETGDYVLKVTHFCIVDGVETTAEETASFEIKEMKITLINIVPGAVGAIDIEEPPDDPPVDPPVDVEGFWFGSAVPFWGGPELSTIDVYARIGPEDRYGTKLYPVGETIPDSLIAMSSFGTSLLDENIFVSEPDALYYAAPDSTETPEWIVPTLPVEGWLDPAYTLDGDTLTLHQDLSVWGMGVYDWVLTRVPDVADPTGIWTGVNQEIPTENGTIGYASVEFEMHPDGTYSIIMHQGDPTAELDFSTRGYWWIAGDYVVVDPVELHMGDWVSAAGIPNVGWSCPYEIDELGYFHIYIDFGNDGTFIGHWVLEL